MAGKYLRFREDRNKVEDVQFLRDSQGKIDQIRITTHFLPDTWEKNIMCKTIISREDSQFEEAIQREKAILEEQIKTLNTYLKMLKRKDG